MANIDPIANMLSILKNASSAGKQEVAVPYSNLKYQLALLLKKEGFVEEARKFKEKGGARQFIAIALSYDKGGKPRIQHVKRISKSGQRIYSSSKDLKAPSIGIKVLSTSKGLLTDKEAKRRSLGGEVLLEVW
jgi:small subunit ribosomal protein S8